MLLVVCGVGSLQAPQKAEAVQLKTSPTSSKTVSCSQTQDSGIVTSTVSSAVEPQSSSSVTDSFSSRSSSELDETLVTKPQPPPALFPSKLFNPATLPCPKLPHFLLIEGKMSPEPDEKSSAVQDGDVESAPSVSSGTCSEQCSKLPIEGMRDALRVGSDISSEPLTFHTNFGDGCSAVPSSVEEESNFEGSLSDSSKSDSKVIDVNENIRKKEFVDIHCDVKDSKIAISSKRITAISDPQKIVSELFDSSRYLPVTTSTVVVNMVLSTVVTQPEDQNSTALEPDAANNSEDAAHNSHENSECDMSVSNEASTQEASSLVSSDVLADKKSEQQEKSSSVAEEGKPCQANDDNKSDGADQRPSLEEGSHRKHKKSKSPKKKKSKSPDSEKREARSRSKKRDRCQSHERKKHRSRSSQRKRRRSRSNDRSGKQSTNKSPGCSPQRDSSRRRDNRRSRSSSRNRQRSSSPRERHSRTRRTSTSRSSRRKEHSRSRSREIRRRSRSRSRDSRRRSRSTDRGRHRRKTRSPSRDHSRRSVSKDRKVSRDKDAERRDEKPEQQVDRASASLSRNYPSDQSHDSPRHRDRSPSRSERVMARREEGTVCDKSGNSDVGRSVSSQQSDSDMSNAEASQQRRSREENVVENNRIAVISSSSGTNRQHRHEEFELDEEPPADMPTAYDPSEPTEDNFRDERKVSGHRRMPPHWVPPANHRMPVLDTSRPPPGFPARLPAPPSARFPHGPPREDMKSAVVPPNQFGVAPSDGGRPPLLNMPLPLPRPGEVRPPMAYSRPMLTTPGGALPPPPPPSVQPLRLPHGMNVETVPLIVRGPMEPPRLLFVPPGVGQPMRLAEATPLVGLQRIVCPPAQGTMPDLVRLPIGQPQPPPGTILSGPPFGSMNQVMVRHAPMMIHQVPERTESPQSAPQVITSMPISQVPRMSASNPLLMSNMPEMPLPPHSGQPSLPNVPVPPGPPAQPQTALALSSSSASSPSSGSPDAEDMLLERYSAKPEPPQSLFPSQKTPDPPKPPADVAVVKEKSPDRTSEELEKSSDSSQPPEPPPSLPVPDLKTTVTKSLELVPVSTSDALPSDPRLLVQFLLKQTRQSTVVPGGSAPEADKPAPTKGSESSKPSPPKELPVMSENSPDILENSPGKDNKNNIAYSPSQADYLGEDEGNPQTENVREMKVCFIDYHYPQCL